MMSKLQRVSKYHLNHLVIKCGIYLLQCVLKLLTQVNVVWLWLDVSASINDVTGHLSFSVY